MDNMDLLACYFLQLCLKWQIISVSKKNHLAPQIDIYLYMVVNSFNYAMHNSSLLFFFKLNDRQRHSYWDSNYFHITQQHSLLSQASWGRLEMKPKRHKGHGSCTLIASLQALLSKAISWGISQSLRSLLTDSSQVSLGLPLPLFTL